MDCKYEFIVYTIFSFFRFCWQKQKKIYNKETGTAHHRVSFIVSSQNNFVQEVASKTDFVNRSQQTKQIFLNEPEHILSVIKRTLFVFCL